MRKLSSNVGIALKYDILQPTISKTKSEGTPKQPKGKPYVGWGSRGAPIYEYRTLIGHTVSSILASRTPGYVQLW